MQWRSPNWLKVLCAILSLALSALSYAGRHDPSRVPFHQYVWIMCLVGAALLLWEAFATPKVRSDQ